MTISPHASEIASLHAEGLTDAQIAQALEGTPLSRRRVTEIRTQLGLLSNHPAARERAMQGAYVSQMEERERSFNDLGIRAALGQRDPVIRVPVSPMPLADNILTLEDDGSGWGLFSDPHIPYHNAPVLEDCVAQCQRAGIRQFVCIGDWLDGNQFHPKRGGLQHPRRWQEDVETAKTVFRALFQHFERGVFIAGNHDEWFAMHMRGQVDMDWCMDHFFHEFGDRAVFTGYEQAILRSGGDSIRLIHGNKYRPQTALSVAKDYSSKFGEVPVVMGHQHHHEAGFSRSGKRVVVLGGANDPRRQGYVHRSPNLSPPQTQGFAIVRDGFIRDYPATRSTPEWAR